MSDGTEAASRLRRVCPVLFGTLMGLSAHLLAGAFFMIAWFGQALPDTNCFPDEDGTRATLVCSLLSDAVLSIVVLVAVARSRRVLRGQFLSGALAGWALGLVLIVMGAMQVEAFRDTLGSGCGGYDRAPWDWR